MAAYRFCRSDDIGLLTDALNRCWSPHFPDEPAMTPAAFKRSIRERQVWCSSCMVAFAGADPIGVLIGAKRPTGTLVHKIAVHPDHRRQDHGRHLLTSLASKLAILGPPRTVAEVPETLVAACGLFAASGFREEARLTDYVLPRPGDEAGQCAATEVPEGRFVIPVSVDDLVANGLVEGEVEDTCWQRAVATLTARKEEITGLAVASDERIEAYLLYVTPAASSPAPADTARGGAPGEMEIVAMRSCVEDDGWRLRRLLTQLRARSPGPFRLPKVHPREASRQALDSLGFLPDGAHLLFAATAGAEPARTD